MSNKEYNVEKWFSRRCGPIQIREISNEVLPKCQSNSQISIISEMSPCESQKQKQQSRKFNSSLLGKLRRKEQIEGNDGMIRQQSLKPKIESKTRSFLKTLLTQRLIEKFKRNLLTNAYILSNQMKQILNEKFLSKSKQEQTQNRSNSEGTLFQPDSYLITIWNIINIIMNLLILWLTPLIACFGNIIDEKEILLYGITIYLIIDIFSYTNRAILSQGQLINSRFCVIKHYIQFNGLNDILQLSSWFLISINTIGVLKLLIILVQYICSYRKLSRNFENHFEQLYLKGSLNYLLDLITLCIFTYFYAHLAGCMWYYISHESSYIGKSWLIQYDLLHANMWVQYNYSFYWSTMTMTTVGFGDITPQNQYELIYAEIIMLLSTCIFAYSVNSIGIILKNVYDTNLKYRLTLLQVNQYMLKHQVQPQLQSRIRNYLKYFIEKQSKDNIDDVNKIITNLPKSLQYELTREISMKIVKQIKPIIHLFSEQTQHQTATILEQNNYTPGDIIYKQNNLQERFIYFVSEGEVELIEDNSDTILKVLRQGESFGFQQFFTGFPPKMTARSNGFTEIYRIDRSNFLKILSLNRKDFEFFHHIKDQIIYHKNLSLLDYKCAFCSRGSHQEIQCPLLQYKPDIEQRLKKSQFQNEPNQRFYKTRIREYKINSLGTNKQFLEAYQQFRDYEMNNTSNIVSLYDTKLIQNQGSNIDDLGESNIKIISKTDIGQLFLNENKIQSSQKQNYNQVDEQKQKQNDDLLSPQRGYSFSASRKKLTLETIINLNQFNMLDEFQCKLQFQYFCLDQLSVYQKYQPYNNVDQAIKYIGKHRKRGFSKLNSILESMNKYTFYQTVKIKAFKLKRYFINQKSNSNLI